MGKITTLDRIIIASTDPKAFSLGKWLFNRGFTRTQVCSHAEIDPADVKAAEVFIFFDLPSKVAVEKMMYQGFYTLESTQNGDPKEVVIIEAQQDNEVRQVITSFLDLPESGAVPK